nr:hypothetical protein [Tanacetum cinerariifolium]
IRRGRSSGTTFTRLCPRSREDPVDYPADGGDDGDNEEESSEDDEDEEDDEMDVEVDEEEEEEEHPAPSDSVVVSPIAADQAPFAEETEPFKTDESTATPPPHPAYRTTARISIPAPVPMPTWTDLEIPFPPLPPILSPPSPVLSPAPPPSPIRSLGYRAAMIRLRDEAASISSPPLQLPSANQLEVLGQIMTLLPLWIERSYVIQREVGYEITDSWDEIVETLQGAPVSIDTELGGYVREFETRVRQDTDEIYMRLD